MPEEASEETKASAKPKKALGEKGTQRQPLPPREPSKRRQRTEVNFQMRQNPEEEDRER